VTRKTRLKFIGKGLKSLNTSKVISEIKKLTE
jgi:hypothetical protein